MNEKLWTVYAHVNKENRKTYVGITSKNKPEQRWNSGRGYKENPHFYAAIQKYGWDNFEHVIIGRYLSEREAKSLEKEFIKFWRTQDPLYGYNMTSGGDGTPDCHPTEETRRKLSIARRKENLSPETLKRRSDGLKGRKFSDDHKQKIGRANSKSINMFTVDGIFVRTFSSAREAELNMGISHSHISQCCNGKRNTSGGYKWAFAQ